MGIRAEAGSLRPNAGVPQKRGIFLVLRARDLLWGGRRPLQNNLSVGRGGSRRKTWPCIALHCVAVLSLRCFTVRHITSGHLAARHTTPWHVCHGIFCFSGKHRAPCDGRNAACFRHGVLSPPDSASRGWYADRVAFGLGVVVFRMCSYRTIAGASICATPSRRSSLL